MSRSIQGKAFSWPIATSTSSHSIVHVRLAGRHQLAAALVVVLRRRPSRRPCRSAGRSRAVKALGTRKLRIGMPSCIASSFSQGEAFISSKPERTTTLTSSPPRRREVRQQSIAVLPPPSTITRLPICSMWPKETLDSQSMPIWMLAAASCRPGHVEVAAARRAGADEDRVVALGEQRLQAVDALAEAASRCRRGRGCSRPPRRSPPRAGGSAGSGCGSCRRRAARASIDDDLVAERRRSRATVSEAGPAPIRRSRLPFARRRAPGQAVA